MSAFHPTTLLRTIIGLVLLLGASHLSYARHIVGGEVYYDCLGPGSAANTRNYQMIMKIYRDCASNGADFDNPARIGVYSHVNGVYAFVRMLNVNNGEVTNLKSQENPCLILPPNVCVEESSYTRIRCYCRKGTKDCAFSNYVLREHDAIDGANLERKGAPALKLFGKTFPR